MKRTLILGASPNINRYAYKAAHMLKEYGHEIVNVGIKKGELAGEKIHNHKAVFQGVDTVTLYIGAQHQPEWYTYILETKPKRLIFNPGTENPELASLADAHDIETLQACTLVMLSVGNY
ncbi:CoA-binding protein [Rapidithrix thailandica]|uniref:CoA-binding protein n=1 Tax=Rapidithrix thailandica TaxID=413964 RepID=A0AAW9SJ33_9BACT